VLPRFDSMPLAVVRDPFGALATLVWVSSRLHERKEGIDRVILCRMVHVTQVGEVGAIGCAGEISASQRTMTTAA
jgi:hypothetical protein